jgi:hypothetical protein
MGVPVCSTGCHPGKVVSGPRPEEGYPGNVYILHLSISLTPLMFHVGIITMNLISVVEKDDEVEVPLPLKFC